MQIQKSQQGCFVLTQTRDELKQKCEAVKSSWMHRKRFVGFKDEINKEHCYALLRREDNERVNNTAAYDKQYLEGRYGADPYLRNMLTGGD